MAHTNEHQPDRVPNQRPESDQSWPDVKTFTESDLTDPVLIGKGGYGVVFRRQWKKDDGWIDIAEKQILHNASLDRLVIPHHLFILLSRKSDKSATTSSLRSCRPSVYHSKTEEPRKVSFPAPLAGSSRCPFDAER